MNLLTNTPEPVAIDHAANAAASLLAHIPAEVRRRADNTGMLHGMFWDNPLATPAQTAAAMGTKAAAFLQFASLNVVQFQALADAAGIPLSDIIPDSDWMPRLPLTPNADGTVTVGSVDGLDAWGRPLPVAIPEPDPETSP